MSLCEITESKYLDSKHATLLNTVLVREIPRCHKLKQTNCFFINALSMVA